MIHRSALRLSDETLKIPVSERVLEEKIPHIAPDEAEIIHLRRV